MAGAEFGVDIMVRARDLVQSGAQSSVRSLRGALASIGSDVSAGISQRTSRDLFRGLTMGAIDAVNSGLKGAAEWIADWRDGVAAGEEGGKSVGLALGTKIVDTLKSIPIAGAIGTILAEGVDALTGGTMQADRMHEKIVQQVTERSKVMLELTGNANDAADAFNRWRKDQTQGNSEDAKWIKMQEDGIALVEKKFKAELAATAGNLQAGAALGKARENDINSVKKLVATLKFDDEAADRRKELTKVHEEGLKRRTKATNDLAAADAKLAAFRDARSGVDPEERAFQQQLREGTELVDARFEALKILYEGQPQKMQAAIASHSVELGQMRDLLELERRRAAEDRSLKMLGEATARMDDWTAALQGGNDEDRKWQDQLSKGIELINEKYAALRKLAGADATEQSRLDSAREGELNRVQALVDAKRAEELQTRRLNELKSAETRLAGGIESHAVLAQRFRANAGVRAAQQAAQLATPSQSIIVDPRLYAESTKQTQLLERAVGVMRDLLAKQPEFARV